MEIKKGHPIHTAYSHMKSRTTNKNHKKYKHYGERGIKICDEWQDRNNFYSWSLANGWKKGLSIDRINNDGNYEPSNCRWTTITIQNRNTRKLRANNTTGFRGVYRDGNKFTARICVDNNLLYLGIYKTKECAAKIYDNYITSNNLEHTKNFVS